MVKAKHIMKPIPALLQLENTVEEAIGILKSNPMSSVPVVSGPTKYHGVLTDISLMKIFLRWQVESDKKRLVDYRDSLEIIHLANENETFPDLVKKIVSSPFHRIFVINNQLELVGTIGSRDILPVLLSAGNPNQMATNYASGEKPSLEQLQLFEKEIEQIRSELYLYESFFSYSPYMMHSSNAEGTIRMANDMIHAVLGYDRGELIGKTIFDIYPPENHEKARQGIKKIIKHGYHQMIHAHMVCKNKTVIEVEMASRQLSDQTGKPIGTITVSRPLKQKDLLASL